MAVLGRLLFNSSERLDLTDLMAQDSYTAGDFKFLIKSFVGDTPCILKGFDIIDPVAGQLVSTCQIRIADAVAYFPSSSAGSFFYGLPAGNDMSAPLAPELRRNATNYVYVTFTTIDTALDSRTFWDPDKNNGAGGEFTLDINTESVLNIAVGTSVSMFPDGTMPIAKIITDSVGMIKSIEDCRQMFFRLGAGGAQANPSSVYDFRSLPAGTTDYSRQEPPITSASYPTVNPFQGGDKNIYSLKEWMDAVMTKIKELSGSSYWYSQNQNLSVASVFLDTAGSTMKSKGTWEHDASVQGKVTWTEDILYKSLMDPRDLIIRQGLVTLANEQVAFVDLLRNANLTAVPISINFVNGLDYISGPLTAFQNLRQGDWIKKIVDDDDKFLRVESFHGSVDGTGGTVAPAQALSVKLNAVYAGTTESSQVSYTRGVYLSTDVVVAARNSGAMAAAGGNFFWLASRSDTILNVASAVSTTITGTVSDSDATVTTLTTVSPHGLLAGDSVTFTNEFTGTYVVDKVTNTVFTISTPVAITASTFTAHYALVTTGAYTSAGGMVLESANHGFETGDTVFFAGVGAVFNGARIVNYRSATQVQVPVDSSTATITTGTVSCVRVDVRKSFGAVKIVQGESIDIGEADGSNIQSFIGMTSLAEETPVYTLPVGYDTLRGQENFNALETDNLTERVSKLTAMMADRVQDRGLILHGSPTIRNDVNVNPVLRDVSASSTISLLAAKAADRPINLTCTLPVNSAGYVIVSRDGITATTLTMNVESIGASELIAENKIILFYRLSGAEVYAWDGQVIAPNGSYTVNHVETGQNKNVSVFYTGLVQLDASTGHVVFADTTVDLQIDIPGSAGANVLDTSAVMALTPTMLDGQALWVRINRAAAKTFNVLASSDIPDTNAAGAAYITARTAVPVDQDVFVLYERIGDALLALHQPDIANGNIYEEVLKVVIGSPANSW
jgi:hypothetical protein